MKKLYPGGRAKAFSITFDDGVLQDIPFVALLNQYGLKGTFNLNSRLMQEEFSWMHPCGMEVKRLSPAAARGLYDGHEIASHTLTHPYMHDLSEEEIRRQLWEDKQALEQLFGRAVEGFAVPFDYYSETIARCARECGFAYARISEFTGSYTPCRDYYHYKTGFYHVQPGLADFAAGFLRTRQELALCHIVGHSYDLDAEGLWGTLELICAAVSAREDIWPCTNAQLVRYLKALDQCRVTARGIENPSDQTIWLELGGSVHALPPGAILP